MHFPSEARLVHRYPRYFLISSVLPSELISLWSQQKDRPSLTGRDSSHCLFKGKYENRSRIKLMPGFSISSKRFFLSCKGQRKQSCNEWHINPRPCSPSGTAVTATCAKVILFPWRKKELSLSLVSRFVWRSPGGSARRLCGNHAG